MKIAKILGTLTFFAKLLIWALKNNWIKFEWDLPGKPIFWTKLNSVFDDRHITDSELVLMLEELRFEVAGTFGEKVVDALIWAIQLVAPIDWSVEGKWESFWKPIIESVKNDRLDNREVGNILETVIRW